MQSFQGLERIRTLFALAIASFVTHWILVPSGLALLNSDLAIYTVMADLMREGHWSVFQLQDKYGGVFFTVLRAGWSALWDQAASQITDDWHVAGHMAFTYGVIPTLHAWAAWWMVRQYASRQAALMVGLMMAVGFNFINWKTSTDFFAAFFFIGMLLLGWRGQVRNPFLELSLSRLAFFGFVAGFALYTARASIVFLIAFLFPWRFLWEQFKVTYWEGLRGRRPVASWERLALWGVTALFSLFAYLEVFGPEIGTFFGRPVKLHAQPNLTMALGLLVAIWLWRHRDQIRDNILWRSIALFLGGVLGFFPEIYYWAARGMLPPLTGGRTYSFKDTLTVLGMVPETLRRFFAGGESVLQVFSLALLIWAGVVFVKRVRKSAPLEVVAFSGILALWAYIRVYTYALGPDRYLLPLMPTLFVALGLLWDEVDLKKRPKTSAVLLGLFCLFFVDHLTGRAQEIHRALQTGIVENTHSTIAVFRKAGVKAVISDDYWHGNRYSTAARNNPIFAPIHYTYVSPEKAYREVDRSQKVGVLLMDTPENQKLNNKRLLGHVWKLQGLGKVGDRILYLGSR